MAAVDRASLASIEVEHRDSPPVVIVRPVGELDFGSTPDLVDAVGDAPPAGGGLILDLSGVTFCDSSALGAMIAMHKAADRRGGALYLVGAQPQVRAAIEVTSLDQLFHLRDGVDAVCAELAAG